MPLPDATLTISDGALGVIEPTDAASSAVGTCSSGDTETVYAFSDQAELVNTLGTGPLVEAAAHVLAIGGGVVYCVRAEASDDGAPGSVTHSGTGVSVMTVAGAPPDAYRVIVEILTSATDLDPSVATFRYSLDGGDTYSQSIAMPISGEYELPGTDLTIEFTDASFVDGDTYSFDCTAPLIDSTTVSAALDALMADSRTWKFVNVLGSAEEADDQATLLTAVGQIMAEAETNYRFAYAIGHTPDLSDGSTNDGDLITAFANFADARVMVCAGYCELASVLTGRVEKRPASFPVSARRHKAPISEDAARVRSGPLPGVSRLWRDEQVHRGLDAERFCTLRTIVGKRGFFITNGRMMATTGSDYGFVQHREMMDVACRVGRAAMLEFLGDDLRVNPASAQAPLVAGGIDERDARAMDAFIEGALRAALLAPGHVSACTSRVNRAENILSTSTVRNKMRILPKGYARFLEGDIGYTNPALEVSDGS